MKKVEMSEAGLRVLLGRAEAAMSLWVLLPGHPLSQTGRDAVEACREARDRLGMPPREPAKPEGSGQWSVPEMFITSTYGADAQGQWEAEHAQEIGGQGASPAANADAPGFDWGAYNAANQGKPRNPDGTVGTATGGPLPLGAAWGGGEDGPELFVPSAPGRLFAQGQVEAAMGCSDVTLDIKIDELVLGEAMAKVKRDKDGC